MFDDETLNEPDAADGDPAILALFDRWLVERQAAMALPDKDGEVWEAQLDLADEVEAQILAIPATGAAGLAIKLYLGLYLWNGSADLVTLGSVEDWHLPALRDGVRFAPVLEPLCREVMAAADRSCPLEVDDTAAALLIEWRATIDEYDRICKTVTDENAERTVAAPIARHFNDLEDQMMALPVSSARGLAVKLLLLYRGAVIFGYADGELFSPVMADVVRLAPDLAAVMAGHDGDPKEARP